MRRIVAMLLAVLVAAVVSVGIMSIGDSAPAEATYGDTRTCVTPREAKAIELSMTRKQISKIFDSNGWRVEKETVDGMTFEEREYRACWSKRKDVHVYYVDGRAYAFGVDWGWWE
jgi:hypothetical protein